MPYKIRQQVQTELVETRHMLLNNLRRQNNREVELLKSTMIKQLKKSVDVQKMPSVRVRPTLKVELKHRVMNCKIPTENIKEPIKIDQLNESVLTALRKSKRAGLGAENTQVKMIETCQNEISKCKNLDEIR